MIMSLSPMKNCPVGGGSQPDPSRFVLGPSYELNGHILIYITYDGCTNYGGLKLLLFTNTTRGDLEQRSKIDPHFECDYRSPFARFQPVTEGYRAAQAMMGML
jgi:hypothetical protein